MAEANIDLAFCDTCKFRQEEISVGGTQKVCATRALGMTGAIAVLLDLYPPARLSTPDANEPTHGEAAMARESTDLYLARISCIQSVQAGDSPIFNY